MVFRSIKALEEPSLWELSQKSQQEVYRFLWLRSFLHPIAIRVEVQPDGSGTLTVKETDGAGGYGPGKLIQNRTSIIPKDRLESFLGIVDRLKYWDLPTKPNSRVLGLDGAQWIIEATKTGRYKIVDRWSEPKDEPIHEIGTLLMNQLAKLQLPRKDTY